MRPPRFSVQRLMIVILMVAALLAAFEAGRRWEHFRAAPHGTLRIMDTRHNAVQ